MSAAATLLLAAPPFVPSAKAQLLPDTGTTMQVGALHQQLEGLLNTGASTTASPGWTISPALGAQESWTNQLLGLNGTGKSSFMTTLLPSVLINGQTDRTNTTINYAPSLEYYSNASQYQISQNLDAASKITLVPERLFLDLRGFASVQPTYAGYGPAGTTAVANQAQTQTLGFSAHPYLRQSFGRFGMSRVISSAPSLVSRQSFGDLGDAELGATLSHASQNGVTASVASGQPAPITTVGGQNLTSEQEYFSLSSGPAFGRTSAGLQLSGNQQTGTGVLNNAHQDQAVVEINPSLASHRPDHAGEKQDGHQRQQQREPV